MNASACEELNKIDASGVPHDARIHSTPAKITKKGFWRSRRGVSSEIVDAVMAELYRVPASTMASNGGAE